MDLFLINDIHCSFFTFDLILEIFQYSFLYQWFFNLRILVYNIRFVFKRFIIEHKQSCKGYVDEQYVLTYCVYRF